MHKQKTSASVAEMPGNKEDSSRTHGIKGAPFMKKLLFVSMAILVLMVCVCCNGADSKYINIDMAKEVMSSFFPGLLL